MRKLGTTRRASPGRDHCCRRYHSGRLDSGEITPEDFLFEILHCPEFRSMRNTDSHRNFVRLLMNIFIGETTTAG